MAISTVSASCRALAGNHGWLSRNSTDWRSPACSRYTVPTCTGTGGANGQSSGVRNPSTSSGTRPDSPSLISSPRAVAASSPSTRGSELSSAWRHPLTTDARNCLPVTASPLRTIRNLALQHRNLAHPRQRVAHEADDRAIAQPPVKDLWMRASLRVDFQCAPGGPFVRSTSFQPSPMTTAPNGPPWRAPCPAGQRHYPPRVRSFIVLPGRPPLQRVSTTPSGHSLPRPRRSRLRQPRRSGPPGSVHTSGSRSARPVRPPPRVGLVSTPWHSAGTLPPPSL